jgi:hypothetical protein
MDPSQAQRFSETNDSDNLDGIALVVSKIRDLSLKERLDPKFLSPSRLQERVEDSVESDLPDREADRVARILSLLGATPPVFDLKEESKRVLGQQILGFYDPETKELVVKSTNKDGQLSAFAEVTLAHEIEHALADQNFGLGLDDDPSAAEADAALAERSVAEGDAVLTMQLYMLQAMSFEEQADLVSDPQVAQAGGGLEETPHYIKQSLKFPYTWGLEFVCDLYRQGGWKAIDRAYEELPESSAQIIFPERYRDREAPVKAKVKGELGAPWVSHPAYAVGAADLLWLFEAPANDTNKALADPLGSAGALAGGKLVLWTHAKRSAIGMTLMARPGADLCSPVKEWMSRSRPTGSTYAVSCQDRQVRVLIGPSDDVVGDLSKA